MPTDIYFRSAISGYNKSDVINFIEKLNSEQIERVNDLNERLRASQSEARKLSADLDAMQKKCAELEAKIKAAESQRTQNDEKAQKYDAMQGTYADIMLDAEHTAKEKVKAAEEKAKAILEEANEVKKVVVAENQKLIGDAKTEFVALMDKLTASLDETLSKLGTTNNE